MDGQSIVRFAAQAERYLDELSESLKSHNYHPQAVRRVAIDKGHGKTRPLGIPTVKDRIVQTAVKMVIEPIFENEFLLVSYGFRPGRGCKDALREINRLVEAGYTHVVDADLAGYFDSIPQDRLLARVSERISDGSMLAVLKSWLEQDVVEGLKCWKPESGTPQGAVISPLLANIYLHPLDCLVEGEGFDFLGYRFECGRRYVRKKSMKALRDNIRSKTKRCCGKSLKMVIADLNPMLRGWFGYFKHAYRTTLTVY